MPRNIEPIEVTTTPPSNKRIAWWFENTIKRSLVIFFNAAMTPLRQLLSFSITDFVEDMEKELVVFVRPFANMVLQSPKLPGWARRPIEKALAVESPIGMLILTVLGTVVVGVVTMGAAEPAKQILTYHFNKLLRPYLFEPGLLVEMFNRGIINENRLNEFLEMTGVSDYGIIALKRMRIPTYDDSTLTQLYFKKDVSIDFIHQQLIKRGLTAEQRQHWFKVREIIPSPGELISIAVREGFNDAVASRFGYDEDYPVVAAEYAEKQGLDQKFFKAHWRAHWILPGLVQVREMYHRGIISNTDLQVYLKSADIPSFWRRNITTWMQRIVTRVDARRMYDLGIWNESRIFEHYQELGYSTQDATDMTLWTSLEYMSDSRELTKTDILSMYRDGILNDNEATSYLTALDFKPNAIILLLSHQILKRNEQYERTVIQNVQKLYVGGFYSRSDVFVQMGKLDTPSDVIVQSLTVWDLAKELAIRVPSITQLRDMVRQNVISVVQFREQLRNKKYNETYIAWYVALWDLE